MKQKLALAGAFIPEPRLLMLDEPLTGLDAAAARQVKDILTARVAGWRNDHYDDTYSRGRGTAREPHRHHRAGKDDRRRHARAVARVIGTDGATKVALTTPSSIDLTGMSIIRPPRAANAARSWCHVAELGGAGARSGSRSCPEPKPMEENLVHSKFGSNAAGGFSRRRMLQLGGGVAGASLIPGLVGQVGTAYADDKPPIGTWPAGSQGDTVTIGATVPRTGAYAVQGEDELKGMQLAVEHINEGNDLIKQIAPKVTKGVLGKQVTLVVADSAAKPNERGAGTAGLHQREQDHRHDRLDFVGGRRGAQQVRRAREDPLSRWRSPAPTTPPARTARATPSASASTARPRPTRSARCW